MSGNCRVKINIDNQTNETVYAGEVIKHKTNVVHKPSDVEAHTTKRLAFEIKGTSGTATGAEAEVQWMLSRGNSFKVHGECPFSSNNSANVKHNMKNFSADYTLKHKTGECIIDVIVREVVPN